MGACTTAGPVVTHADFGQSMHEVRVQGGESLAPDEVRELFDRTAKQICKTVDDKPGYEVVVLLEEPARIDPLWDMPESALQQRMARRHYDVYRSNMEGKIRCE
jgi:hypothetical protein